MHFFRHCVSKPLRTGLRGNVRNKQVLTLSCILQQTVCLTALRFSSTERDLLLYGSWMTHALLYITIQAFYCVSGPFVVYIHKIIFKHNALIVFPAVKESGHFVITSTSITSINNSSDENT